MPVMCQDPEAQKVTATLGPVKLSESMWVLRQRGTYLGEPQLLESKVFVAKFLPSEDVARAVGFILDDCTENNGIGQYTGGNSLYGSATITIHQAT